MTTIIDVWNFLPFLFLLIGSFGIPHLYTYIKGRVEGERRGEGKAYPPTLQGLVLFALSLLIYWVALYSSAILGITGLPSPVLLFLLRFVLPLPVLAVAALNWYGIFIRPSPFCPSATLTGLGILLASLGAITAYTLTPMEHPLNVLSILLFFLAGGAGLTAASIAIHISQWKRPPR